MLITVQEPEPELQPTPGSIPLRVLWSGDPGDN